MRDHHPSDTALLVARSIVLASKHPRLQGLVAEGELEVLERILEAAGGAGRFDRALRSPLLRRVLFRLERAMVPGIIAHYLVRKRWIEGAVRGALAGEVRQVAVVGAGFDALGWRLRDEFDDVDFWELDHPATQAVKRGALGEADRFHWVPVDLTEQSPGAAIDEVGGFRKDQPSVVVAEGLTMYLSEGQVASLLENCGELAGENGRVIFTYMEDRGEGEIGFRGEHPLVRRWLARKREPFRWGATDAALDDMLARSGLRGDTGAGHEELRAEFLQTPERAGIPLAEGERICVARKGE